MSEMSPERLAEIREMLAGATDLPWRVGVEGSEGSHIYPESSDKRTNSRRIACIGGRVQPEDGRNARAIVGAVNALPDILAHIDHLTARVADAWDEGFKSGRKYEYEVTEWWDADQSYDDDDEVQASRPVRPANPYAPLSMVSQI